MTTPLDEYLHLQNLLWHFVNANDGLMERPQFRLVTKGSVVTYLGPNVDGFALHFKNLGS